MQGISWWELVDSQAAPCPKDSLQDCFCPAGDAKRRARAVESASVSPKNKNKSDTHYQVSLCWWELVDSNDFMPPYPAKILTTLV